MTTPLTDREEQVRSRVSQGLSSDEIAAELGISKRTVEAHLRNVFQKLSVTRRNQLAGAPARPEVVRRTPEVEPSAAGEAPQQGRNVSILGPTWQALDRFPTLNLILLY